MWKRRQNKLGRQQAVGDASPTNNTLGGVPYGGVQATFMNVNTSPQDGGLYMPVARPPPEAPRGFTPPQFQPAPIPPPETGARPPSSIYDIPSPKPMPMPSKIPRHSSVARKYGEQVEISPPSSPDIPSANPREGPYAHGGAISPDISPVDETLDLSSLQITQSYSRPGSRAAGTNIPVLRREKRRNQIGIAAGKVQAKHDSEYGDGVRDKKVVDTRWDTLTGEPTTSERGRPPQVKPREFTPPGNTIYDTAEDHGLGLRTTGSEMTKGQSSFGDRVKKLKENTLMSGARPEWQGSSGRSKIVPPVADQFIERPKFEIPRKSSKRATSPRNTGSGTSTPVSVILSGQAETSSVSPPLSAYASQIRKQLSLPPQEEASHPNNDLTTPSSFTPKTSHVSTPSYSGSALIDSKLSDQYTGPMLSQVQRQPLMGSSEGQVNQLHRKDSTSSIERNLREALKTVNLPKVNREQPTSRFSVTTYATSTANSTPRVSTDEPPPIPAVPQDLTPMVNRRRPLVGGSFDSTKATARKAVPGSPVFISMSSRDSTLWRNSKMLPKSPPEVASVDLVTSLQAQLDDLARRRANIQKGIYQMTQLMPSDPLARGMEARRQAEEKQKVEMLKEDLADVVREEHDLGLKLHRALKRRDQNAVYEPTGLWVRRVTG